ncbi:endoglucanase [Chitinispirillum alkaliphilum]|nr:endoglucanase [Chitinispirillum alkaliphilum]
MFGMDWLMRMQNEDGSVLSVMGLSHASPPSSATGQSLYGPANTIATRRTAAAFALGATVFRRSGLSQLENYADTLHNRALLAWQWAETYPDSIFHNNRDQNNSRGLAAGNQEVDDTERLAAKLEAAVYLFELTGDTQFRALFDENYKQLPLFLWNNVVDQYRFRHQSMYKYYAALPDATPAVRDEIRSSLTAGYNRNGNYIERLVSQADPYRAFIDHYNWGSNAYKSTYGISFWQLNKYSLAQTEEVDFLQAAESYLHYIHGVNPLGMVYLSNMGEYGAGKSVTQFFHAWFSNGSPKWDEVGVSEYGPAPGFLTGGPNKFYDWDGCCPSDCDSPVNNARCFEESIQPPRNQPPQKSYKDFNTSWPLNSWEVTENSCGYQSDYIRLLSKFVSNQGFSSVIPGSSERVSFGLESVKKITVRNNVLEFSLPANVRAGKPVQVDIFSLSGKLLNTVQIDSAPGKNRVDLPSENLSSGTILVRLRMDGNTVFRNMVYLK